MSTTLRTLWAAGGFGGLAQSLAGVAGTLLARRLGDSDWVAGLPQGLSVLGAAGAAAVLSRMMARSGRRPGLVLGGGVAVAGCAAGALAAAVASVALLAVASVLVGWGMCAVMFARYAAADLAAPGDRARMLASVLAAISVGAVVGPNLLAATAALDRSAGLPSGCGAYAVSGLAFLVATLVWRVGLPAGRPASQPAGRPAPPWATARATIAVLSLANLVMVATMTMAPVEMQMHDGSGLGLIGLVVSAHIAAMFAPSPLSGRLVLQLGDRAALLVACAVSAAATGTAALAGGSAPTLASAMVLLGLGWNLATVAASTMLARDVPIADRALLEGRGEVGMGVAAAVGGGASGLVMTGGGYPALAGAALGVVLVGLVPLAARTSGRPAGRLQPRRI